MILGALILSACGDPDALGGRSWDCRDGRGERVIDGAPSACPVEDAGALRSWGLTLPAEDGPGAFTEWTRGPDEVDAPTEHPADAVQLGPSAWQLDVPTYRCPGCDPIEGLQDGLTLTCAALPGLPAQISCGGADGSGTGWDLRLAEAP